MSKTKMLKIVAIQARKICFFNDGKLQAKFNITYIDVINEYLGLSVMVLETFSICYLMTIFFFNAMCVFFILTMWT